MTCTQLNVDYRYAVIPEQLNRESDNKIVNYNPMEEKNIGQVFKNVRKVFNGTPAIF